MKSVVVDASVAVKWVVEEAHSHAASLLLQSAAIHAPDHWQAEAVNALWSKVFKRDLTAQDAEERMTVLLRAPVAGAPIDTLMTRAFAISVALAVTVYDSLYLALADKLRVPLVTADRVLVRRVSGDRELAKRTIWVGSYTG